MFKIFSNKSKPDQGYDEIAAVEYPDFDVPDVMPQGDGLCRLVIDMCFERVPKAKYTHPRTSKPTVHVSESYSDCGQLIESTHYEYNESRYDANLNRMAVFNKMASLSTKNSGYYGHVCDLTDNFLSWITNIETYKSDTSMPIFSDCVHNFEITAESFIGKTASHLSSQMRYNALTVTRMFQLIEIGQEHMMRISQFKDEDRGDLADMLLSMERISSGLKVIAKDILLLPDDVCRALKDDMCQLNKGLYDKSRAYIEAKNKRIVRQHLDSFDCGM